MASTNTQMGLQVPTSAAKLPVQPLPKDNSHSYKISQVQPNRVNTFQTQTPIAKLKRKSVIKRSMPSESNDSSSTMSRLEPPKVDYAAKWSARLSGKNVEQTWRLKTWLTKWKRTSQSISLHRNPLCSSCLWRLFRNILTKSKSTRTLTTWHFKITWSRL